MHSVRSCGADLTPVQLAAAARAAGLDFIATTEHNTVDGHGDWRPEVVGDLLVILGQEVVTAAGHWLALGLEAGRLVDWRPVGGAIANQLARVHRGGGIAAVAHPHAPYSTGTFQHPQDGFDLVEVWNGAWSSELAWQADNDQALADWARALATAVGENKAPADHSGRWRAAIGNSDAHLGGQIGIPHTVVRADEPSPSAILAGLRAGHSWIADAATIDLTLTARVDGREAGIGERLLSAGQPIIVEVDVGGVPGGCMSVHTDDGQVHRERLPERRSAPVRWATSARDSAFVRVEIRHPDGRMAALSNPIILS